MDNFTDYQTAFIEAYVGAALWSSTDNKGEPLDNNYSPADISQESLAVMILECKDFIHSQWAYLSAGLSRRLSANRAGRDFWLTRNHRDAGFWDRGLGSLGDNLSEAAHSFGSSDLYVGDDDLLHVS